MNRSLYSWLIVFLSYWLISRWIPSNQLVVSSDAALLWVLLTSPARWCCCGWSGSSVCWKPTTPACHCWLWYWAVLVLVDGNQTSCRPDKDHRRPSDLKRFLSLWTNGSFFCGCRGTNSHDGSCLLMVFEWSTLVPRFNLWLATSWTRMS